MRRLLRHRLVRRPSFRWGNSPPASRLRWRGRTDGWVDPEVARRTLAALRDGFESDEGRRGLAAAAGMDWKPPSRIAIPRVEARFAKHDGHFRGTQPATRSGARG